MVRPSSQDHHTMMIFDQGLITKANRRDEGADHEQAYRKTRDQENRN